MTQVGMASVIECCVIECTRRYLQYLFLELNIIGKHHSQKFTYVS